MALARSGEAEGLWLRADRQTGGRGRLGRSWNSPEGNLHASTLVRLRTSDPAAPTLALVAAVALEQVVSAHAGPERVAIKWPNDLLLDGAKLAGILLERADDAVVVGFGVNLASHPEELDRPAASLGASDPDAFLNELAESFSYWLSRWRGEGLEPVRRRWVERAHPAGAPITARLPDGTALDGLFDGIDAAGALRLRLASGDIHVIHAGDIFLIQA